MTKQNWTYETAVELADMDAWEGFVKANESAIVSEYGSIAKAYLHATQGGLVIGGGAAPLFRVFFAD
jgi:hypothetical protein